MEVVDPVLRFLTSQVLQKGVIFLAVDYIVSPSARTGCSKCACMHRCHNSGMKLLACAVYVFNAL